MGRTFHLVYDSIINKNKEINKIVWSVVPFLRVLEMSRLVAHSLQGAMQMSCLNLKCQTFPYFETGVRHGVIAIEFCSYGTPYLMQILVYTNQFSGHVVPSVSGVCVCACVCVQSKIIVRDCLWR